MGCTNSSTAPLLDLRNQNLSTLPDSVYTNKGLEQLDASHNSLTSVSPLIQNLATLTQLNLHQNFIVALPSEIRFLERLTRLDLGHNKLKNLPDCFSNLISLEFLDLSSNQLESLPRTIGRCIALKELFLSKNALTDLPDDLSGLKNLHTLTFEDNPHLNTTFTRFRELGENDSSRFLLQFLDYRSKHAISDRFGLRTDATRPYFADHGLQTTSWVDPRYYEFVRTVPSGHRHRFKMDNDPFITQVSQAHVSQHVLRGVQPAWLRERFLTDIPCEKPLCLGRSSMQCSYRFCLQCCQNGQCVFHNRLRELQRLTQSRAAAEVESSGTARGSPTSSSSSPSVDFLTRAGKMREDLQRLHPPEPEKWAEKPRMRCHVRRSMLLEDSFQAFMSAKPEQLKLRLNVQYHGEEGLDWGGLSRDWFCRIMPEIANPNYALFTATEQNPYVYRINPLSSVNPDHLQYFRFVGRVLGKALFDNFTITVYFTPVFYKKLLGLPCTMTDLEMEDQQFYQSLVYLQENDAEDMGFTFTVTETEFDVVRELELKENGADLPVTNESKGEFIRLMIDHKLNYKTTEQMKAIRRGFYDLIPQPLLAGFTAAELELLLCGTADIDVADWKANTDYAHCSPTTDQCKWFWEIVDGMSSAERAKLLQFVTGTTKVPSGGFAKLIGAAGPRKFTIYRCQKTAEYLPIAHTCFNQIDIPVYQTKEQMVQRLNTALMEGAEGFYER